MLADSALTSYLFAELLDFQLLSFLPHVTGQSFHHYHQHFVLILRDLLSKSLIGLGDLRRSKPRLSVSQAREPGTCHHC